MAPRRRLWTKWRRRRLRRWPGGARKVQIARRSLQLLVLALLFLVPTLSHYDNLRNQRDEVGIAARWDTRLIDGLVEDLEEPRRITQAVRGSVWTLKAGELVISDPLAVVDFLGASRVFWDRFLLTALIPVALSLVLGRVFCGWLCPADLLFEVAAKARSWARIKTDVAFPRSIKFTVLALGLVTGAALGSQIFAEIYPPRIVSGELYLWITFGAFGAGAWFFLTLVAFEIFVSKRFWCRYVCPGGALYSLLGRFRFVRLKVDHQACSECRLCNVSCEFGLDPMSGNFGAECNNCGQCVRACGHDALVWKIGLPPRDGLDVVRHQEVQIDEKAAP